jgi:hypothetical protein
MIKVRLDFPKLSYAVCHLFGGRKLIPGGTGFAYLPVDRYIANQLSQLLTDCLGIILPKKVLSTFLYISFAQVIFYMLLESASFNFHK